MFTGLVQTVGHIASLEKRGGVVRLVVTVGRGEQDSPSAPVAPSILSPALGDSICVSGVCLTVVEVQKQTIAFDVIPQTLSLTTLGTLKPHSLVNLESALTPTTALGGHFVSGHIDGLGRVREVRNQGCDCRLTIDPIVAAERHLDSDPLQRQSRDNDRMTSESWAMDLMDCIIPKGCIAIDGVSLTVAAVDTNGFEVALIPTTLQQTTLGQLTIHQQVNLETDLISKTVVHYLRRHAGGNDQSTGLSMQRLRQSGFAD